MSIWLYILPLLLISMYVLFIILAAIHARPEKSVPVVLQPPCVSVLVPCRNEALNIEACLQSLQRQGYDKSCFEVILIDDGSSDATVELAGKYRSLIPLDIISAKAPGKKNALLSGIECSKYPLIITLDADCWMGPAWLKTMSNAFIAKDLDMLCGPVNLDGKRGLFTLMQQAESAAIVGVSAMMLNSGRPTTCNGANLMFRKDVFEKNGGYDAHLKLASGDDDLLMHTFYRHDPGRTRYILQREAMVYSCTSVTAKEFIYQRLRWISKGKAYLYPYNGMIQLLVLLHLAAFYISLSSVLFYGFTAGILAVSLKYLADLLYAFRLKRMFDLRVFTIFIMPFYQLYILLLLMVAPFIKAEWKARKIR
jgi:cellulose synthase/poly-beta-1,6-N-acetylglucosamine synthase-like glycosyltransferase